MCAEQTAPGAGTSPATHGLRLSPVGSTAVDEDDLTRDETGPVRGQEGDGGGDVVGLAEPVERHLLAQPVLLQRRVGVAGPEEVGLDRARLDRVHPDAGGELTSQVSGQAVDAGL